MPLSNKNALIIFTKNPILGTVKTRIGKVKGDAIALEVYKKLLLFTRNLAARIDCNKTVYFNHHIEENGIWDEGDFDKAIQAVGHLGMKMSAAFEASFKKYERVIIIGSDCTEINETDIEEAFASLMSNDIVIGPAVDGGYYLIGMNKYYPYLFQDMPWSQEKLFQATMKSISDHNLSVEVMDVKSDIDFWEDWEKTSW